MQEWGLGSDLQEKFPESPSLGTDRREGFRVPSLGPHKRQRLLLGGGEERGGWIKCSTAPGPALAPRIPSPGLSWPQPAWDQLCLLTSSKVPSKCQVEKLPVGESEAVCVLSDKWHGVKWAMILIASDSRHPLTPCLRMTLCGENQR